MNRNPGETEGGVAALALGIVILGIAAGAALCHCSASTPTAAQTEQVGAMGAELDACVVDSSTQAEWRLCRATVLAKYAYDAGQPLLIVSLDAGGQ